MKVINKLYKDWTPTTRKQLRSLSLRGEGDICKVITKKPCDTFVAFENGMIVGWAIYVLVPWYHEIFSGDFMIYIRKFYRHRGIAKIITNKALNKYGKIRVHAWNESSGKFFSSMKKNNNLEIVRGFKWMD